MRVLFIGDIVGRPGRRTLQKLLPKVRNTYGPFDFVIANVENSAGGFGITQKVLDDLLAMGIDCMTSGNHIWDKKRRFIPIGFGTQVATTCQLSSRLSRPRKRSFEVRRGKVVSFEPLGSNIYVRRGLPF